MSFSVGFHASHELYAPSTLLSLSQRAEQAGFRQGSSSDHFHPWTVNSAGCGLAWPWLGAALQGTKLSWGVVCAPGQRYHPAIIAQAVATLLELYPGRFWIAVGSGEALNESITGEVWPDKATRNARLFAAVEIMRELWRGETVTSHGHVTVRDAKLTLRLVEVPPVYAAALTPETAHWAGSWADGLIVGGSDHKQLQNLVSAFKEGGGEGKPLLLQSAISYGSCEEEALHAAYANWPQAGLSGEQLANLATPQQIDQAVSGIQPSDVAKSLRCSSDLKQHVAWLERDRELGFSTIYLHYLGKSMEQFIDTFGESVLPALA
jgi:coenzyme F420-dependent glucose-6-phosphate dehydrogenase